MSDCSSLHEMLSHALNLAQRGDYRKGREIATRIREEWRTEDSVEVTADLMLVDAICLSYSGDPDAALDRLSRAILLASISRSNHRIHLTYSWLATVSFNLGGLEKAVEFLALAAKYVQGVGSTAIFRSATTVAVLLQFCGFDAEALLWFRFAQRAASTFGHSGLMSHLLYNMAAARVASRLFERSSGVAHQSGSLLSLLAVKSSINFDQISGVHVQSSLHPLVQAQALGLEGDFLRAFDVIDKFLVCHDEMIPKVVVQAQFEKVYILENLGASVPVEEILLLEQRISDLTCGDDLARAYTILQLSYKRLKMVADDQRCGELAGRHCAAHKTRCSLIVEGLRCASLLEIPQHWWDVLKVNS